MTWVMWGFIILNLITTVHLVDETRKIRRIIEILDKQPEKVEHKDMYKDWRDPVTGLLKARKHNSI